jgi:HSP20 family molecular chaperone IbpA
MSDENESINRIWVSGCDCCSCDDEGADADHVSLRFDISGVKKEDIDLRVIPDGMRLIARKDPKTEYFSEYRFMCPADIDNVVAVYDNGELDVSVPIACEDPYVDSRRIDVA